MNFFPLVEFSSCSATCSHRKKCRIDGLAISAFLAGSRGNAVLCGRTENTGLSLNVGVSQGVIVSLHIIFTFCFQVSLPNPKALGNTRALGLGLTWVSGPQSQHLIDISTWKSHKQLKCNTSTLFSWVFHTDLPLSFNSGKHPPPFQLHTITFFSLFPSTFSSDTLASPVKCTSTSLNSVLFSIPIAIPLSQCPSPLNITSSSVAT